MKILSLIAPKQLLAAVVLILATAASARADFYVSPSGSDSNPGTLAAPFQTVDHARQAVRGVNGGMSSDITVYLRGGTYFLNNTLAFDQGDSGFNGHNVIYRSYPGDPSPVISGGRQISGWTLGGGGIYHASVPPGLSFRQLYVNDQRAIRARTPNVGSFYNVVLWVGPNWAGVVDGIDRHIDINASEISNWNNLNKVEMVISREWQQHNLRIASFTTSGGVAHVQLMNPDLEGSYMGVCYLREPSDQGCNQPWVSPPVHSAYYFENALEFLDSPGEFYLDDSAGLVYYMPRSGEDMSSAVVMVPTVQRLIQVQGQYGNPVRNLQFYGITFEHSTWMDPSSEGFVNYGGDVLRQFDPAYSVLTPGGLYLAFADGIRLERNIIRNMGGAGLAISQSVHNLTVIGNVIKSISAAAIHSALDMTSNTADSNLLQSGIVIQDNFINQVGQDYHSSDAIMAEFATSLSIDHNEISDGGYTGIGVIWPKTDGGTGPIVLNFRNNDVHNVMNMMADGGGLYTNSVNRPGAQMLENYVHDIHRSAAAGANSVAGLYLDDITNQVLLKNNVTENVGGPSAAGTGDAGLYLQCCGSGGGANNGSYNNTIYNFTDTVAGNAGYNTFINDGSLNATAVKANAGIEAAYQDIKNGGSAPPPPPPPPPPSQGLPIQFTSATLPETHSVVIPLTVPANATAATLQITCFDCDHSDFGNLVVNGGAPMPMWVPVGLSNASAVLNVPVALSSLINGNNTFTFTKTGNYGGGTVSAIAATFTVTPPLPPAAPTGLRIQ